MSPVASVLILGAVAALLLLVLARARRSAGRAPAGEPASNAATLERELQFANLLLRTQLEASPQGILVVDDAGTIISYNRRLIEICNLPPALFEGRRDEPVLASFATQVQDAQAFLARVRFLYQHPEESDVDEIAMKDGRVLERRSVQLKTPAGQSLGRVWFFGEITESRKAVRSAVEERDFVSVLLDSLPGYFALLDGAGRLVRRNDSLRLLNGVSDEDMLRVDPFANVVEGDREILSSKIRETLKVGFGEAEVSVRSKSRGVRTIRWHARRIAADGMPQVLAVGTDLTDIRAAEALTRASEDRFRVIFESVSDGILVQDVTSGAFVDANPPQYEMFGYTREEFLQLNVAQLSADTSAAAQAKIVAMRTSRASDTIVFEWLCRAKDGHEFWCEIAYRYLKNFGGREVLLSTARDITTRRQAAADLTYRNRILNTLTLSVAELVKTSSFAASMPALLRGVGEELDVDRILVVQNADVADPKAVSFAFSWQREGVPKIDASVVAHLSDPKYAKDLAAWFEPLLSGWPVMRLADSATGWVREIMLGGKTLSNLLVPISVGGTYWGHIAADDTHVARQWTTIEIESLRTYAEVIGALIARERTAAQLQKSEEQFHAVSETVLDAIIMIGTDGRIRYWNHSAQRIFGYTALEANGKMIHEWLAPERFREKAAQGMADFVATGHGPILGQTVEMAATRKDGVEIAIELSINAMTVGAERFAVGIARDITDRKRANSLIERMARYDILTELPNRRLFSDALERAIARAVRSGDHLAVLYLDLDRFKDVNDTLGHPIGDRLLQAVAKRLLESVREMDTVARFGGDEFAAVQIDIRDPADAAVLAAKLVKVLSEPFVIDGNEIHSGTSLGIAVYGPDSPDAESLLAHADVALYRAKADGRGTYRFYTETMDTEVRARVALDNDLREALASDQFFLLYQPQVDVATGRIAGLEALVRWRHPKRGVLEPGMFIPAAEKSGLIAALGNWVLREVCRQAKEWLDAGIAPPTVSVNVSPLQFKTPVELEQSITSIVAKSGLPPERLEIELTETALMEASKQHNDVLLRLRTSGMRLAIDDFGNGYSSLNYLRRFHVDRLKIPQNFIDDLSVGSGNASIVRATLGLAHELGITVVAEGVETVAQYELLKSWGCDGVQGYFIARPLPAAEAAALLRVGIIGPAVVAAGVREEFQVRSTSAL